MKTNCKINCKYYDYLDINLLLWLPTAQNTAIIQMTKIYYKLTSVKINFTKRFLEENILFEYSSSK